jgi:ubiquinone/menaquinone biosynthesis C-methylase UbiE
MSAYGSTVKAYRGLGMEKSLEEFKKLARRTAEQIPPQSKVLEIAPGPGYFAIELAKLGDYQITGLDISETFVKIASANAKKEGMRVDFRQGNAAKMPFPDDVFDFLVCRAAFKNFSEPVRALEEMHRVLRPGGHALIIDLRRDASKQSIKQAVNGMHLGMVNGIITKLTFQFMLLRRAYTESEMKKFLSVAKFRNAEIQETLIGLEISLSK